MGAKFKFLIIYFFSWVCFFEFLRLLFLVYHFQQSSQLSFSTLISTFVYGLRMDLSVSAYILAPVCLFVLFSLLFSFFRRTALYNIYTLIVLILIGIISLTDLEVYKQWGFRIDNTPLKYLNNPNEAIASISHLPIFTYLIFFIISIILFYLAFRFVIRKVIFDYQNKMRIITAVLLILFMGLLIIPIRGGLQLAPINQSSVYFSTNNFANHAAINASWNFLHSLTRRGSSGVNPYNYLPADQLTRLTDSLFYHEDRTEQVLKTDSINSINVILVIWESFTEKAIHVNLQGKEVTPEFNKLKNEGIFFSNVYASGDRTNKGVPAILSGYPAMPSTTIIHSPGKSQKLASLSKFFKQRNYSTPFIYGGEPEFANIKSYLLSAGFDPIIGKDDFEKKDMNSKWGAHDGTVMNRVSEELDKVKKPFFATWLTLSSHEPFETPDPPVFSGTDNTTKFLNSLHYTDRVINEFINHCKKQSWWNNTIIVITGDHGNPMPETNDKSDNFRIPMLWIGGALKKTGVVITKTVSQLDLASSLTAQFNLQESGFPFSKNVFDSTAKSWAFFSYKDGFGFVDTTGKVVYDLVGNRSIITKGEEIPSKVKAGQAVLQFFYDDFIKK